jgi:acetyl-CoA decarbonylase/synthase complex subunit gamma
METDELTYITGSVDTSAGEVPRVSTSLDWQDWAGTLKVRFSFGRMNYRVEPGLYAVGEPAPSSVVLVTANYKLSFDSLRCRLNTIDAWILVLDTKSVNVWCAAGKGTFGTDELVRRIEDTRLSEIVDHRSIIVPQLGATGVAAHEVKKRTGFSVVYGPVRAKDLPEFLVNDMSATPAMRRVTFTLPDRLVLIPTELVGGLKYLLSACIILIPAAWFRTDGQSLEALAAVWERYCLNLVAGYLGGIVLGPVLLPWLPGRSFSMKGVTAGTLAFLAVFFSGAAGDTVPEIAAWYLLTVAAASFLTMNFTGSSTYTSLSGVIKEMKIAVPLQITGTVAGIILLLWSVFM